MVLNLQSPSPGFVHVPPTPGFPFGVPIEPPMMPPIIYATSSPSSSSLSRSSSFHRPWTPPQPVVIATGETRPPRTPNPPTSPAGQTSQPSKDTIQFNPEVSLTDYLDYYNRLYQDQEKQRETVFSEDQDSFSATFDEAEAKRKAAGTKRIALLGERTYEKQFRDDQEQQKYLFKQQVAIFDNKISYRATLYTNAQTSFSLTFEQDQTWIKKQFGSANTTEKKIWDWLRAKVVNFLEQYSDSVDKLIRSHDETFSSFLTELKQKFEPDFSATNTGVPPPPMLLPSFPHGPGIIPFVPPFIQPSQPHIIAMPPMQPPTTISVPPQTSPVIQSPQAIRPPATPVSLVH